MLAFRCRLCGEVTMSDKKPRICPSCGVKARYLKPLEDVISSQLFTVRNLTDTSRQSLLLALNMVTNHASYYKCVSEQSKSEATRALFKRMAKITREHADIFRKYLGLDPISFSEEECSVNDEANIVGAIARLNATIDLYREAQKSARETGIADLFKGLIEVEQGMKEMLEVKVPVAV